MGYIIGVRWAVTPCRVRHIVSGSNSSTALPSCSRLGARNHPLVTRPLVALFIYPGYLFITSRPRRKTQRFLALKKRVRRSVKTLVFHGPACLLRSVTVSVPQLCIYQRARLHLQAISVATLSLCRFQHVAELFVRRPFRFFCGRLNETICRYGFQLADKLRASRGQALCSPAPPRSPASATAGVGAIPVNTAGLQSGRCSVTPRGLCPLPLHSNFKPCWTVNLLMRQPLDKILPTIYSSSFGGL